MDVDRPADGVEGGEELVLHLVADDGDGGRVLLLQGGEEAPRLEVDLQERRDVGRVAGDGDGRELRGAGPHVRELFRLPAHRAAGAALGAHDLEVARGHGLALAGQDELQPAADDAVLREDQDVGVQVDDLVEHEVVQAADDGEDGDDRHHADDHAQEREPGPQLVHAQGLGGHGEQVVEAHGSRDARPTRSRLLPPRRPCAPLRTSA